MMLFGIIGIFVLIYVLIKTDMFGKRDYTSRKEHNEAIEVLKKRYAEGSITHEEFIRMKDKLEQ